MNEILTYQETLPDQLQRYNDMLDAYYRCLESGNVEDAIVIYHEHLVNCRKLIDNLLNIQLVICEMKIKNRDANETI